MLLGTVLSAAQALVYTLLMFIYMRKEGYFEKTKVLEEDFGKAMTDIAIPEAESSEAETKAESKDSAEPSEPEKKEDLSKKSYSYGQSIALTAVMFLSCFLLDLLLYRYKLMTSAAITTYFRASVVNALCFAAAITDIKRRKIPNKIVLFGLVVKAVILVFEIIYFSHDALMFTLYADGLGFLLGFVMLMVIGILTKGLGFGDVKLFGVIGLLMGSGGLVGILFVSLLLSAIVGITLIASRKKTLKSAMPMAPFIYLGTLAVECLGIF